MAEILTEVPRVCDAVLDQEYFANAAAALAHLAAVPGAGLQRGRADVWAGGILYLIGQDVDLWAPYGEPYVPAAQFARIVGASQSALIGRANKIREVLGK